MSIQKIKILIVAILASLLFNGCSQKKEQVTVYKYRNICFEQSIFKQPNLEIHIANEDIKNAKKFKIANDSAHSKYQEQVDRNNERCKEIKDEK